jgi:hypothetical protein
MFDIVLLRAGQTGVRSVQCPPVFSLPDVHASYMRLGAGLLGEIGVGLSMSLGLVTH